MSTPNCRTCHLPYWRYRGDFPPRGFCSVGCFQTRKRKEVKASPEKPAEVMEAFRDHRLLAHETKDLTTWFDCEVCERFEERYSVSTAF